MRRGPRRRTELLNDKHYRKIFRDGKLFQRSCFELKILLRGLYLVFGFSQLSRLFLYIGKYFKLGYALTCDPIDISRCREFGAKQAITYRAYRAFSHDVTAAMLDFRTNPVGVELFSYINAFFCCNKFA